MLLEWHVSLKRYKKAYWTNIPWEGGFQEKYQNDDDVHLTENIDFILMITDTSILPPLTQKVAKGGRKL